VHPASQTRAVQAVQAGQAVQVQARHLVMVPAGRARAVGVRPVREVAALGETVWSVREGAALGGAVLLEQATELPVEVQGRVARNQSVSLHCSAHTE